MNHTFFPLIFLIFSFCYTIPSTLALTISGYGIKDLEGNDPITFQKEADWWNLTASISSAKITQTTATHKWLLGGPNILGPVGPSTYNMSFYRTYTKLPPHTFVTINAVFWYFDTFGGVVNQSAVEMATNSGRKAMNPKLFPSLDFPTEDGGIIGIPDLGRDHVRYGFPHFTPTLVVSFVSLGRLSSDIQSFGFRELHIHLSNSSKASFITSCHISEDAGLSLQWDQCPCPIGQGRDSSDNCVSCAAHCNECFGPAAFECLACSAGAYWDGTQCNSCHLNCQTCTGVTSNDCPSCKYGFYNYGNNTCIESCKPPFRVEKRGLDLFCLEPCSASQFYWSLNQTCFNKCDYPLLHAPDENGIEYCLNPCEGTGKYLYANGSCLDGCKAPLVTGNNPNIRLCINPCPVTSYLFSNGSCLSSCPFPLLSRSEPGAQYCWNPCFSASYFLYGNGSCEKTCPAPLISRFEPGVRYCYTPCASVDDYIYDNRSCGSSCVSPLLSRNELLVARYCLNPCPSNYFLYPNGSCFEKCHWPLTSRTESGIRYCYSPCAEYIFPNGTCSKKCLFPLMIRTEPGFNFCYSPCPSAKYLYDDQLCYDNCGQPLIRRLDPGGINYCSTPCHSTTDYVYPDGVCHSVCEYPYKAIPNVGYRVCSMNMDEIQTHQAYSLANLVDITNTVCGIGGLLTGFVLPGDPNSMLMWSLLKMMQSVRFVDVNFPTYLTKVFAKENENYLSGGGGGFMSSYRRRILAEDFGKFDFYNIPNSFLENYWQQLIVFAVLVVMIIVSAVLSHFLKTPKVIKILKHLKSALKWNLIIMFFCGTYGDLILFSTLEFQSASFENFASIMNFLACLVMVLFAVYIPLKILYVIKIIRKAHISQPAFGQKDAEKSWLHNRVFFESYKSDQSIQHIFLLIFLMRVAFFNILIGYLFKSPLVQGFLINFISSGMLIYLFSKSPIKDKLCFAQHVMMETMLLVYNMCLLILGVMDLGDVEAESTRAFFGGVMVLIMVMAPIGTAVLIGLKLTLRLQELYLQYRAKKDALELVTNDFRFKKVRARGRFIVGENNEDSRLNIETLNLTDLHRGRLDESNLVVIPQNQKRQQDLVREINNPQGESLWNRLDGEGSSMNFQLESNMNSVRIYSKKGSNLKRRKVNIFRNDEYLPD